MILLFFRKEESVYDTDYIYLVMWRDDFLSDFRISQLWPINGSKKYALMRKLL